MTVWSELIGQERAVRELSAAAATTGSMTHAWLLTGPPGSGRSVAARAFAAALQCSVGSGGAGSGCGNCVGCRTALAGTHADVEVVSTRLLSIGVADVRSLVARAVAVPVTGRWQVIVVTDADRLTESAANALLKSLEEPAPRTVWLLCAPAFDDVIATVRSRCRHVSLRSPTADAIAGLLVRRDGINKELAAAVSHAAQGHVGWARRLATDPAARQRRDATLRIPSWATDVGGCLRAAAELVTGATAEAKELTAERDSRETEELSRSLGAETTGRGMVSGASSSLKELERQQKRRATRAVRDCLDRALLDLAGFYRDVLVMQLAAGVELIANDARDAIAAVASSSTPELTLRRIDAVLACREALSANVAPLLSVESMVLRLRPAEPRTLSR
jgi:DNA polymerase III subunit delta'